MSYRGKQSCLFAAISIYFVIFASTASNARPPQAIPEEAKRAKPFPMISSASNALMGYLRTSPISQMRMTSPQMKETGKSRKANHQQTAVR
jgi:hypothetical protein